MHDLEKCNWYESEEHMKTLNQELDKSKMFKIKHVPVELCWSGNHQKHRKFRSIRNPDEDFQLGWSPKLGGHISAQGAEDELKNNQKVHIISEKLQGGNGKKSETYILPMTASVAATGTCVESTQPPKNPNPPGRSRLSAIVGHFWGKPHRSYASVVLQSCSGCFCGDAEGIWS
jgi:hypothetical protein